MLESAVHDLAQELLDALDNVRLIAPPSSRDDRLDLPAAHAAAAEIAPLRTLRGERTVGRKIGYTNRNIWQQYNVSGPIWGRMYARTVQFAAEGSGTLALAGMVAPRIEPEIAFKLSGPVPAGCAHLVDVLRCVEWVARAFEIVDCHYLGWKFTAPDSVIDFGHHAALVVGAPLPVDLDDITQVGEAIGRCTVSLGRNGTVIETGLGSNALGHPALALAFLADIVAQQPGAPPLEGGEIITTGTLTSALPVADGELWATETAGLPLPSLTVALR